jgi:hypothetical protein
MKTFRELYCEHHGVAPDQFERTLVRRALHWHARPFYWLLALNQTYRSADCEFVRGVGELRSRRGFHNEAAEFHYHPHNHGFLRTALRLRVSSHRLQSIFEHEIHQAVTTSPFETAPKHQG